MSEVLSFTNEVNVLNCSTILPPTEGLFMELTVPIPGLPSIKQKMKCPKLLGFLLQKVTEMKMGMYPIQPVFRTV